MIESLHSPHVGRVKALISSKGAKERRELGLFVAEGIQSAREAIGSTSGPEVKTIYATESGLSKIANLDLSHIDLVEVSDDVMRAMSDTVTPQGVLSLCYLPDRSNSEIIPTGKSRYIYLHEIQDPGNAGTILRTADAMGFDGVITSPNSVDMYSPKVVRSTAGSLWHVPVYERTTFADLASLLPQSEKILLTAHASQSILDTSIDGDCIAIFGNEARGVDLQALSLDASDIHVKEVRIPMAGRAESLNLSAAASIVMFHLSAGRAG